MADLDLALANNNTINCVAGEIGSEYSDGTMEIQLSCPNFKVHYMYVNSISVHVYRLNCTVNTVYNIS